MSAVPTVVEIVDRQQAATIPPLWVAALQQLGPRVIAEIGAAAESAESALSEMAAVDVALVDDVRSAQVHVEFMGIEGPTDVISFDYGDCGELVIGAEVMLRQARQYKEPPLRELLRYMIHGLLHLAGYDDIAPADRELMIAEQERLVQQFWSELAQLTVVEG